MSDFTAAYSFYALPSDGTLNVSSDSALGQIEVSDSSASLASHSGFEVTGSDGPFDGQYSFVSKASGPNGLEGFIAKDGNGHSFFFTTGTVAGTNEALHLESGSVPICFLAGTHVRTPHGDVPVETLATGDLVNTADGAAVAIRWIGRQTVVRAFADTAHLPICVRADALGDNVPCRDLYLSPNHALLIDGVLVQAGSLVNGTSIVRMDQIPARFTYFHVEVEQHSLILAENTPAETFIDNVDRAQFDNWNEHDDLTDLDAPMVEMTYPRAKAVRHVPRALRDRIERRGLALYGAFRSLAA